MGLLLAVSVVVLFLADVAVFGAIEGEFVDCGGSCELVLLRYPVILPVLTVSPPESPTTIHAAIHFF